MTRRDFEIIATAIRQAYSLDRIDPKSVDKVAANVAAALAIANPRFDIGRFMRAASPAHHGEEAA